MSAKIRLFLFSWYKRSVFFCEMKALFRPQLKQANLKCFLKRGGLLVFHWIIMNFPIFAFLGFSVLTPKLFYLFSPPLDFMKFSIVTSEILMYLYFWKMLNNYFEPYQGVKIITNYMSIVRNREWLLHSTETMVTPKTFSFKYILYGCIMYSS